MIEIATLLNDRKWNTLIMAILLSALVITIPLTIKHTINESFVEHLDPIINSINKIEKRQIDEIIDRGIAAYKKIYEIEQLETSPQNSTSIKIALRTPEARTILFQIDRERTLLFEKYFGDQQ